MNKTAKTVNVVNSLSFICKMDTGKSRHKMENMKENLSENTMRKRKRSTQNQVVQITRHELFLPQNK